MPGWATKPPMVRARVDLDSTLLKVMPPFSFWSLKWRIRVVREFAHGKILKLILPCFCKSFLLHIFDLFEERGGAFTVVGLRINWLGIWEWEEAIRYRSRTPIFEKIDPVRLDGGCDEVFWTLNLVEIYPPSPLFLSSSLHHWDYKLPWLSWFEVTNF